MTNLPSISGCTQSCSTSAAVKNSVVCILETLVGTTSQVCVALLSDSSQGASPRSAYFARNNLVVKCSLSPNFASRDQKFGPTATIANEQWFVRSHNFYD